MTHTIFVFANLTGKIYEEKNTIENTTKNILALTEQDSNKDDIFKLKNGIFRSSHLDLL